ncbi:VWA domain-containing protein [Flavobacterium aciduliphilum]|uniref:von Willebrand factor type A domain-containing protein n=1 Tax=Flavobacterium aciduliphilum TaxID=1101402 RepID=A0A328YK19_9FLAO|nr:VWA domain-containing protein [Flavobacterium aciduliphilum]RAR73860.1 von Willebrand factor type A domain-containing protein [Flavobacterium aciduliphilum]
MKNKKTLYHFVLDRSGSMSDCIEATVTGFNTQVATIKKLQEDFPEQEFEVSLTIFDNIIDHVQSHVSINEFELLNATRYSPRGATALLDAVGMSINQVRITNETKILNNEMSVVMVILTDGMENASREFTYHQIARTISELEATEKWTFTFLGADIDAIHTSKMLNIRSENVVSFDKVDMNYMMNNVSEGMRQYSCMKSIGINKSDFFDFIDNKDQRKK